MERKKKIALAGNPNSGKTSVFNQLTGLNQKIGNYPGVTVDKRSSTIKFADNEPCELIDLPGTYSLSSTNQDEQVVQNILLNPEHESFPDLVVIVVDATNLKRNLFLASQIIDLGIPTIIALNMVDVLEKDGQTIDIEQLSDSLSAPVLPISARKGKGIDDLKNIFSEELLPSTEPILPIEESAQKILEELSDVIVGNTEFMRFKVLNNYTSLLDESVQKRIEEKIEALNYKLRQNEIMEINNRYEKINSVTDKCLKTKENKRSKRITKKIDQYVTHPVWGFIIFLLTFFIIFQAIFTFAAYPMDAINDGIMALGSWVTTVMPGGIVTDFVTDGIIAGLAGVLVFIPQIMILFGLIALLEDSGYLSRVSFMTDGLMRKLGMNGKSIVPLVSGFACAIPAVMAARGIENRKERLITIFITPLMSCSARLPVYVFLVSFIAPNEYLLGFISVQGLYMMGLYLLGIFASLLIAWLINLWSSDKSHTSFILELPNYKAPSLKNAAAAMINKGKMFVMRAGKVILIASMILWVLSYFGPGSDMKRIEEKYQTADVQAQFDSEKTLKREKSMEKLEHSYLGHMGRFIEPAIQPLGYDWKIGVAVLASFAAREVFVGTMATIYSVQDDMDDPQGLKALHFSYATAFSLLIFYVFALQCMSTVAVVKQETGRWSTTILQFVTFTGIAYLASLFTYQILT